LKNHSLFIRATSCALCLAQLMIGVPALALGQPTSLEPRGQGDVVTPSDTITPNRTVPNVTPPASMLVLPGTPTDAELTRARVFSEPLVPLPRETTPAENAALAQAIRIYADGNNAEMVAPLTAFLGRYPDSAWRPSLLANLGTIYRANGYLSRALTAWERAWDETKGETDPHLQAVANFALGEFLDLSAKVGHADAIEARLDEISGRKISGHATQRIGMAREALSILRFNHQLAVASGPVALQGLLAAKAFAANAPFAPNASLETYHAMPAGTSLSELKALAGTVGLFYEMAFRSSDADFPVPSVIHWRVDHYSAVVKKEGARYLLLDPILGGQLWVSAATLNDEASGYVLAPKAALGPGWRSVPESEALTVIGHCAPGAPDDTDPGPPTGGPCGMPEYSFLMMPASLRLQDTPVSCHSPVGPASGFRLTYNQRDPLQPQIFSIGNVGPKWTFDWLSWVVDNPTTIIDIEASVTLRGGGSERYSIPTDGIYPANWRSRAVLAKVSSTPIRYERRLRDGGIEVFAQSDGVITNGRRIYLTDVIDPQGLTLHLTYDASFRIVAVTDAIGLVTTLSYELTSDPLKITKVTDPYGRAATLSYNVDGQLASITDVIGLTSSFRYGADDFITSMTTPYGTTRFSHETDADQVIYTRFLQATDPLGGTEAAEFRWSTTDIAATASTSEVPTGFSGYNVDLNKYNSFYWDKRAMALSPFDPTKATITHWLLDYHAVYVPTYYAHGYSTSVPQSVKRPLEHRVWFAYPDQLPKLAGDVQRSRCPADRDRSHRSSDHLRVRDERHRPPEHPADRRRERPVGLLRQLHDAAPAAEPDRRGRPGIDGDL